LKIKICSVWGYIFTLYVVKISSAGGLTICVTYDFGRRNSPVETLNASC
jgi:hypothetical protein